MAWSKASDKLYQIQLDGKWVDINVPYAKTEKIFAEFVGNGGIIDEFGAVTTDMGTLITKFGAVGDILLTTYGPKGTIVEDGDCGNLSASETVELFRIATDVVENFIKLISEENKKTSEMSKEKGKAKKTS